VSLIPSSFFGLSQGFLMVFIKSFGAVLCYAFTQAHLQLAHLAMKYSALKHFGTLL
jgi:hypothetical protein